MKVFFQTSPMCTIIKYKKLCILSDFYIRLKYIALLLCFIVFILLDSTIYIYIYIQPQGFQRYSYAFCLSSLSILYYSYTFNFYICQLLD